MSDPPPPSPPNRPRALVCGARSGRYPLEILAREPDLALTVHVYDAHQARKMREDLAAAGRTDVEVLCAAYLPEGRMWPRAFFFEDAKSTSAELRLDCLQDLFAHVAGGAQARVEGVDKPTRRRVLERTRDFSAEWTASVPGGEKFSFVSLPGCFCHRRADEGGLALAEVAARALAGRRGRCRVLDMGCGCGFVGLLVADALRRGGAAVSLTLLDSHARAVAAAERNARRLGIDASCVLSDVGTPAAEDGSYDVFLGNPPYYGDWRIAEFFLATARRALRRGGVCYAVALNGDGLRAVQNRIFGRSETFRRRSYAVLASVK